MKLLLLFIVLTFAGIVTQSPELMVVSAWLLIFTLMEMAVLKIKNEL